MPIRRKIRYTLNGLTVIWQPHKCVHSYICVSGLPKVFDMNRRPWIILDNVDPKIVMEQVEKCPSDALSYLVKSKIRDDEHCDVKLIVLDNGPLLIDGPVEMDQGKGEIGKFKQLALCRCGSSINKPFCDGNHAKVGFKG